MISYLKGKIIFKGDDFVILDTGGVGYRVFVSPDFLAEAEEGQSTELFIWAYVRPNRFELYGCASEKKLGFFEFLTGISGIGPKIALSLTRYESPDRLKQEIEERGKEFAKKVKGVGKKKLRQILLELTGKVEELDRGLLSERREAERALTGLGFSKSLAEEALLQVPKEVEGQEKVVEKALKILGDENKEKD